MTSPILKPGTNCWKKSAVTQSGLLIDADNYYRCFYTNALKAQRYILIAGWQFDSDVCLIRGQDLDHLNSPNRFLPFLNYLCSQNPELHIYILAWDFSIIYALEREWFQNYIFNWKTCDRITFCFDNRHALGASHHQKFVVIDGHIGFIGGIDLCEDRWDDECHDPQNPYRKNERGKSYGPYHDVHSYLTGEAVADLTDIFINRWQTAQGQALALPKVPVYPATTDPYGFPLPTQEVAFSRTRAQTLSPPQDAIGEIRTLYLDAIKAADTLIYIENQYFSSQAVYRALIRRMQDTTRPKPAIVMILPQEAEDFIEKSTLGAIQHKLLCSLAKIASETQTPFGVYHSAWKTFEGKDIPTYIHSKLMIIDDVFLTIGSANTNNRSMGLDTELNICWEGHKETALSEWIMNARCTLLSEHIGDMAEQHSPQLRNPHEVVAYLDHFLTLPNFRLRRQISDTDFAHMPTVAVDDASTFDPEKPPLEDTLYETLIYRRG